MNEENRTSGRQHLIGYCSKWTVRPGDRLSIMVSTSFNRYRADIVRLGVPAGSSLQKDPLDLSGQFPKHHRGYCQRTSAGSYIRVDGVEDHLKLLPDLTLTLWMVPTTVPHRVTQTVVSFLDGDKVAGWALRLLPSGRLAFSVDGPNGAITATTSDVIVGRRWHEVIAGYSVRSGTVLCGFRTRADDSFACSHSVGNIDKIEGVRTKKLLIGAAPDADDTLTREHFNGRMESVALRAADPDRYVHNMVVDDAIVSHWDFGTAVESTVVVDRGPHKLDGVAMNMPTRAMPGHHWTGRYMDFRAAPDEYGAIDFHDDDLADANWNPSFKIELPVHVRSGAYAARLQAERHVDYVPFFVGPPREGPRHDVVVILPTFTYQAYANERLGLDGRGGCTGASVGESHEDADASALTVLQDHPEWGGSLYDKHADGSGFMYSSRARPVVNMRPDYVHWETHGPRHLSADLYLLAWLSSRATPHDVVTDDLVDAEGVDVLAPYSVVITGSHPEYCTERILDALEDYVDSGGNLMYLGGNGYYWVTSIHEEASHIIEVRRGYSGTRPWESEPGSVHHSTTGEPGGLWRYRGRPPNRLVGVGFAAHGADRAGYFERTAASFDSEYAWVFDGIGPSDRIGDFGTSMSGAAGDEVDKYSVTNGSPSDAVVLASSAGLSDRYVVAIEELRMITNEVSGLTTRDVRADMVYFRRPSGGSVFSVGSISWITSLMTNQCHNNVSAITENVLRRFTGRK